MNAGTTYGILPESTFSLRVSAGPARWGGEASPRRAVVGKRYVVVDAGNDEAISRRLFQDHDGTVYVEYSSASDDPGRFARAFHPAPEPLGWADPVIRDLHDRFHGLWSLTDGGLVEGLLTSIVGQGISIASAMATQRRLAQAFATPLEVLGRELFPLPTAGQRAEAPVALIRTSGVTWKRAGALKAIAREAVSGTLPAANGDREMVERGLWRLPDG